jgi:hypothetical protein
MKRTCIECEKCSLKISRSNYKKHINKCNGELNYWSKRRLNLIIIDNGIECNFCKKNLKNSNSKRNHERLCKSNPNKQYTYIQTNQEEILKQKTNSKSWNQYTKAEFLGLPKPEISEKTRKKLSILCKSRSKEENIKLGEKISKTISAKMLEGNWHTYGTNSKKSYYRGILFDSSWEVKYAQWLDSNNIKWERCKDRFTYIFNNYKKNYIPDFFLPETKEYVEIKGLKTLKDEAKWEQFPRELKLIILMEKDLKNMGIL